MWRRRFILVVATELAPLGSLLVTEQIMSGKNVESGNGAEDALLQAATVFVMKLYGRTITRWALKHTNQVIQMLANLTGVIVIKVIQILEPARERGGRVVHLWRGCIGREVECTFHYDLDTLPCCS